MSFASIIQEIYSLNPGHWRVHNLNFISISKYSNVGEPFTNIRFNGINEQKRFRIFTGHPLLL